MTMLAEHVDGIIGVDTHRDTLAAAAVNPIGAVLETTDAPTHTLGYQRLLDFARQHIPGRRCWALEGTAAMAQDSPPSSKMLMNASSRSAAPSARRSAAAARRTCSTPAAREALATEHVIQPRSRGEREAMRVLLATRQGAVHASTAAINQLKALIVSAPDDLRAELRRLSRPQQITRCAGLRDRPTLSAEHRMTIRALRSTAQRIWHLQAEARELENELLQLARQQAPELLELLGIGVITAAPGARRPWRSASRAGPLPRSGRKPPGEKRARRPALACRSTGSVPSSGWCGPGSDRSGRHAG